MTEKTLHGLEKFSAAVIKITQPMVEKVWGEENQEKALEVLSNLLFDDDSGAKNMGVILTNRDKSIEKILYGFVEIESSYKVLKDIVFYLRRFPSKHPEVSKTRFLNYHVGNYFNEVYILRERLRSYQKIITRMYKTDSRVEGTRKYVEMLDALVSSFDNMINIRGKHVHQARYSDEDFWRLNFAERTSEENDDPVLVMMYSFYLKEYRSKWIKKISKNNSQAGKILDMYFEVLYPIIFDENGNWIEPLKTKSA